MASTESKTSSEGAPGAPGASGAPQPLFYCAYDLEAAAAAARDGATITPPKALTRDQFDLHVALHYLDKVVHPVSGLCDARRWFPALAVPAPHPILGGGGGGSGSGSGAADPAASVSTSGVTVSGVSGAVSDSERTTPTPPSKLLFTLALSAHNGTPLDTPTMAWVARQLTTVTDPESGLDADTAVKADTRVTSYAAHLKELNFDALVKAHDKTTLNADTVKLTTGIDDDATCLKLASAIHGLLEPLNKMKQSTNLLNTWTCIAEYNGAIGPKLTVQPLLFETTLLSITLAELLAAFTTPEPAQPVRSSLLPFFWTVQLLERETERLPFALKAVLATSNLVSELSKIEFRDGGSLVAVDVYAHVSHKDGGDHDGYGGHGSVDDANGGANTSPIPEHDFIAITTLVNQASLFMAPFLSASNDDLHEMWEDAPKKGLPLALVDAMFPCGFTIPKVLLLGLRLHGRLCRVGRESGLSKEQVERALTVVVSRCDESLANAFGVSRDDVDEEYGDEVRSTEWYKCIVKQFEKGILEYYARSYSVSQPRFPGPMP